MPRPARRTRAVVRTKEPEAVEAVEATATPEIDQTATETVATNISPPAPTRRSRRSDAASVSQTPNTGSRRTSARHAAAASTTATSSAAKPEKPASKAPTPQLARGPDASGLDIMDDTFADIDTNFGDHTLGDLSDLENLENLDDLDADLDAFGRSPAAAAAATADTTAASTSSFNVGLFRRGRPRQSSVHSRDDAPIRPSSRGGNSSAATPSMGSSFSLGTFKRRAREPSILGRHRRTRDESRASRGTSRGPSRGPSRDASREPSRMHSRHTSRDRGADSESELDNTAVTAPQYNSEAESSSLSNALLNTRRAARSTRSRAQAVNVADTSVASSANTTSMLLMGRTRTRAAAEPKPKPSTTTTSRKRKSQDGQREDELPKRRSRGVGAAEMEVEREAEAEAAEEPEVEMGTEKEMENAVAEPMSDISVVPSVEAPEEDAVAPSSPLSSAASSSASVRLSEAELRRRYTTPGGPNDEVMAPPMSSDSESETPAAWPTLKGLTKGVRRGKTAAPSVPTLSRQTPDLVDDDIASDISSPPSLTHSPNFRAAPAKKPVSRGRTAPVRGQNQKDAAPLTTAALAALLPQRHRRARPNQRSGSHDGDNDEENELERSALLSEDDDELAHHTRASLRRGRSATGLRATAQAQARGTADKRNDKNNNKKRRRTYGSRGVSDKENQENQENSIEAEDAVDDSTFTPAGDTLGDDETTDMLPSTSKRPARSFGDELEKAAIKFKEVDKWSLEYESVVRSSSPVDAR